MQDFGGWISDLNLDLGRSWVGRGVGWGADDDMVIATLRWRHDDDAADDDVHDDDDDDDHDVDDDG